MLHEIFEIKINIKKLDFILRLFLYFLYFVVDFFFLLFMTSYIKFTPISGAKNEDPLCYLLEIDEVKILLDCGWSDSFQLDDLVNLKK